MVHNGDLAPAGLAFIVGIEARRRPPSRFDLLAADVTARWQAVPGPFLVDDPAPISGTRAMLIQGIDSPGMGVYITNYLVGSAMPKKPSPHPTDLELDILKVLWEHGPMRVREVRDALADVRGLAYTTVMTVMGIMTKKGYVKRKKSGNHYVYRAVILEKSTQNNMLRDFVDRVFAGSSTAAMLHLLENSDLDEKERARIRALIEEKERQS